jgi:hypothetical protein
MLPIVWDIIISTSYTLQTASISIQSLPSPKRKIIIYLKEILKAFSICIICLIEMDTVNEVFFPPFNNAGHWEQLNK